MANELHDRRVWENADDRGPLRDLAWAASFAPAPSGMMIHPQKAEEQQIDQQERKP
jgi:hypothetical protein